MVTSDQFQTVFRSLFISFDLEVIFWLECVRFCSILIKSTV